MTAAAPWSQRSGARRQAAHVTSTTKRVRSLEYAFSDLRPACPLCGDLGKPGQERCECGAKFCE